MNNLPDCPFCDIRKIKSSVIEYNDCLIFEPLNPVVEGHLFVVPKQHIQDFTKDSAIFAHVAKVASQYAEASDSEWNLITSAGRNATQTVMHCHIHLIPRNSDDGLKLPWS